MKDYVVYEMQQLSAETIMGNMVMTVCDCPETSTTLQLLNKQDPDDI